MIKVILTRGLPASGKTTWSKDIMDKNPGAYKRVNKDELRAMLDVGRWSSTNEKFILKLRDHIILEAVKNGKHVIVDDTNMHPKHEVRIRQLVKNLAMVEVKDFEIDLDTCIQRDLKRSNSVGEKVIRQMHQQFIAQTIVPYSAGDKPWVVLCDLDGTLALLNNRNPYDASTCEQDLLNQPIAEILRALDLPIFFVSGRQDTYRPQTESWLKQHGFVVSNLHMRPAGDMRKDSIVKAEIFEHNIRGKYNVKLVLDDRDQVVYMWRSLGLTCLQVNYGDF